MNYYKIRGLTDLDKCGAHPQLYCSDTKRNRELLRTLFHFSRKLPPNNIEIPTFILDYEAIQTDHFSCFGVSHLFVSKNIIRVLKDFKVMPYKAIKVNIEGIKDTQYYLLFIGFMRRQHRWIDFAQSDFRIGVNYRLNIQNRRAFQKADQTRPRSTYIRAKKMVLSKKWKENFDLVKFFYGNHRIYVSERLKDAFNKNNITGIEYLLDDYLILSQ